jgi:hypothetical protein
VDAHFDVACQFRKEPLILAPPFFQDSLDGRNPVQKTPVSYGDNRLAAMESLHNPAIVKQLGNRRRALFDIRLRYGGAQTMTFDKDHRLTSHTR